MTRRSRAALPACPLPTRQGSIFEPKSRGPQMKSYFTPRPREMQWPAPPVRCTGARTIRDHEPTKFKGGGGGGGCQKTTTGGTMTGGRQPIILCVPRPARDPGGQHRVPRSKMVRLLACTAPPQALVFGDLGSFRKRSALSARCSSFLTFGVGFVLRPARRPSCFGIMGDPLRPQAPVLVATLFWMKSASVPPGTIGLFADRCAK